MKRRTWFVVVAIVALWWFRPYAGCIDTESPDEKLADNFEELCEIARDHRGQPVKGVKKLGRYMVTHLGPMLHSFGSTVALIEKIDDDTDHDARAYVARDRMRAPLLACEDDWARFVDEVNANAEARAMVDRAGQRLSRTLDILFGKRAVELRTLPRELANLL